MLFNFMCPIIDVESMLLSHESKLDKMKKIFQLTLLMTLSQDLMMCLKLFQILIMHLNSGMDLRSLGIVPLKYG